MINEAALLPVMGSGKRRNCLVLGLERHKAFHCVVLITEFIAAQTAAGAQNGGRDFFVPINRQRFGAGEGIRPPEIFQVLRVTVIRVTVGKKQSLDFIKI